MNSIINLLQRVQIHQLIHKHCVSLDQIGLRLLYGCLGFQSSIFDYCCDIGRQWHRHNANSCPPHPTVDAKLKTQSACTLVIGVCCLAEHRAQLCKQGQQKALEGQPCLTVQEEAKVGTAGLLSKWMFRVFAWFFNLWGCYIELYCIVLYLWNYTAPLTMLHQSISLWSCSSFIHVHGYFPSEGPILLKTSKTLAPDAILI